MMPGTFLSKPKIGGSIPGINKKAHGKFHGLKVSDRIIELLLEELLQGVLFPVIGTNVIDAAGIFAEVNL